MAIDISVGLLISQMTTEEPNPESMRLLKLVWPKVDDERREQLLSNLGQPATHDEVSRWQDDDELHRRLLRQWRWLAGIAEDLPEAWKAAYLNLSAAFGEGDPEARRHAATFSWGTSSPLSAKEINELGPERFADWAKAWVPKTGWREPSPDGLRQEIANAVRESPVSWVEELPTLATRLHHPVYIRGVLEGLQEAVRQSVLEPDWNALIALIELVVSEPWSVQRLASDPFDADPDWRGCAHTAIRIIDEALGRDTAFDPTMLDRLWNVLLQLMRRREPKSLMEGRDELLTPAINKLSTKALKTMIGLCLSISRRKEDLTSWRGRLSEAVQEELDVGEEETELASTVVASLYPQFVHISGDPTPVLISELFGLPEPNRIRRGALDTLFEWARPISNEMLRTFRPYLEAYIDVDNEGQAERAEQRAIRWIVIGYIRQVPEQDDVGEVLQTLQKPERISEAAEFYGRVLMEDSELKTEDIELALRFWDQALGREDLPAAAFLGFGWWAEATLIGDEDWLSRVYLTLRRSNGRIDWEDAVVQRLIKLHDQPDAWKALGLMVKGTPDRWAVSYWARNIRELFEQTGDVVGELQEERTNLAERLLEREMHDFREYVPGNGGH